MHRLIEDLRREHGMIIQALRELSLEMDRLRHEQTPDVAGVGRMLEMLTREPDRIHHPKEEILFDRICGRCDPAPPLIRQLRSEHRTIAEQGRDLLSAFAENPTDADLLVPCREYVRAQRWHISQEESDLYLLAEKLLTDQDWASIDDAIQEQFGAIPGWDPGEWPNPGA